MIHTIAADDALRHRRTVKSLGTGLPHWSTDFFGGRSTVIKEEPQSLLTDMSPDETILSHFHAVDQFQVFAAGAGMLGRSAVAPLTLQYLDHHTGYGPIEAGAHGLSFFAMRAHTDSGPVYLDKPGYRDALKPTKRRNRVSDPITLSTEPVLAHRESTVFEPVLEEADGLAGYMLRMGAETGAASPDAALGGGIYYLVVNGSMHVGDRIYPRWSMIFTDATESAFEIRSGKLGLEALVMRFPRRDS